MNSAKRSASAVLRVPKQSSNRETRPEAGYEDSATTSSDRPLSLLSQEKMNATRGVEDTGLVKCICNVDIEKGRMVFCEGCRTWQHLVCFQLEGKVLPDDWYCPECEPAMFKSINQETNRQPGAPGPNTPTQQRLSTTHRNTARNPPSTVSESTPPFVLDRARAASLWEPLLRSGRSISRSSVKVQEGEDGQAEGSQDGKKKEKVAAAKAQKNSKKKKVVRGTAPISPARERKLAALRPEKSLGRRTAASGDGNRVGDGVQHLSSSHGIHFDLPSILVSSPPAGSRAVESDIDPNVRFLHPPARPGPTRTRSLSKPRNSTPRDAVIRSSSASPGHSVQGEPLDVADESNGDKSHERYEPAGASDDFRGRPVQRAPLGISTSTSADSRASSIYSVTPADENAQHRRDKLGIDLSCQPLVVGPWMARPVSKRAYWRATTEQNRRDSESRQLEVLKSLGVVPANGGITLGASGSGELEAGEPPSSSGKPSTASEIGDAVAGVPPRWGDDRLSGGGPPRLRKYLREQPNVRLLTPPSGLPAPPTSPRLFNFIAMGRGAGEDRGYQRHRTQDILSVEDEEMPLDSERGEGSISTERGPGVSSATTLSRDDGPQPRMFNYTAPTRQPAMGFTNCPQTMDSNALRLFGPRVSHGGESTEASSASDSLHRTAGTSTAIPSFLYPATLASIPLPPYPLVATSALGSPPILPHFGGRPSSGNLSGITRGPPPVHTSNFGPALSIPIWRPAPSIQSASDIEAMDDNGSVAFTTPSLSDVSSIGHSPILDSPATGYSAFSSPSVPAASERMIASTSTLPMSANRTEEHTTTTHTPKTMSFREAFQAEKLRRASRSKGPGGGEP